MNKENKDFELRRATPRDLPFILEVQERAMSPATIKVHGSWNHELQRKNTNLETVSTYEVISINGKTVGVLQVFEMENSFEFERLYILPEEQSKGYGSLAMKEIMGRTKNLGKKKICFKVYKINERAIDLYKKNGCFITEELDVHYKMEFEI